MTSEAEKLQGRFFKRSVKEQFLNVNECNKSDRTKPNVTVRTDTGFFRKTFRKYPCFLFRFGSKIDEQSGVNERKPKIAKTPKKIWRTTTKRRRSGKRWRTAKRQKLETLR